MKGVEPPRRRRQILSLVRLPIPPHPHFTLYIVGGGWWIRTTESNANRFTVCPLWPLGKSSTLELVIGIEPTTCWLQVSCSTVEPHQHMAGITGLEPVTHWLTVNCSTNWAIFPFVSINISKSISGVLYLTIIFLGLLSPISSSDLPTGGCEQHPFSPILVLLQVGFTRLC